MVVVNDCAVTDFVVNVSLRNIFLGGAFIQLSLRYDMLHCPDLLVWLWEGQHVNKLVESGVWYR